MKKVLAGIGGIFVRIWTWIKETAWIQPLLIVGIIFGVIFCIPTVSGWIQGWADDATSAETYYKKFRKSLAKDENSDAQKLINSMVNGDDTYGEKYFVLIYQSGCSGCTEAKDAFKLLNDQTGRFLDESKQGEYKLYTIQSDQSLNDTDWDDQGGKYATAWDAFLDRNDDFLVKAADAANNSYYDTVYTDQTTAIAGLEDGSKMTTPTLFLYDVTSFNSSGVSGVSEVMFSIPGDTSYDKATLLSHCWTHTEEFTEPV